MGDKPHNRMEAWKRAMELVADVYKLTRVFPAQERYALVDQMRRVKSMRPSALRLSLFTFDISPQTVDY